MQEWDGRTNGRLQRLVLCNPVVDVSAGSRRFALLQQLVEGRESSRKEVAPFSTPSWNE